MAAATRYFGGAVSSSSRHSRALLLCALLALVRLSSGNIRLLPATNITWSSINFKTLLHWGPKPTNYVYTVELDGDLANRVKTCIFINKTECDVTNQMKNLKDTYTARIYSELPTWEDDADIIYEISPRFTPYTETEIGMPTIKNFEQKGKTLKVEIEDPLTPVRFDNGSFQSMRDIFKTDIEYTLTFWKDQTTGKKWLTRKSNQFEFSIDEGKNYCFFVQATIPSRKTNRNSQKSAESCTSVQREDLDGLQFESIVIIAAGAVGILILIIVLSVVVYKCTKAKSARKTKKEDMPPNL
ncbi:tissue factor [Elgaria multicarinata webbii]|uniref:tissue factor n=1 Tax=Elgaria multicarinata webbii TaxID=159646 RepID=UPI002FCD14B0